MTVLRLTDRCNADDVRKAPAYTLVGGFLTIRGDSISIDDEVVLTRVEPHGLGDVHWELTSIEGPVAFRRYTHIEVDR